MIYGSIDPGPNRPINGPGGGFAPSRILQEVAIKAKADTAKAAQEATVNAIKKLANQSTPGGAKLPVVTASASSASSVGIVDKFKALPSWVKWTAYAFGAIAVVKIASPGRD